MRFSLILATINRTFELSRFLASLDAQTYRDFELIIIDQNPDDRLEPILAPYFGRFAFHHLYSKRGLSRARNVGLAVAKGEIICFPDDDCWYTSDVLQKVDSFFLRHTNTDGLTGISKNEDNQPSSGRWDSQSGLIDRYNIWRRGISYSIFLKAHVVQKVGLFDEKLGVGADSPYQAGEETSYLLRSLESGYDLLYDPAINIYHPDPIATYDESSLQRARGYGRGIGRVLKLHHYPFWHVASQFARTLGGALLSILRGNPKAVKYYLVLFFGKITGWLAKR